MVEAPGIEPGARGEHQDRDARAQAATPLALAAAGWAVRVRCSMTSRTRAISGPGTGMRGGTGMLGGVSRTAPQ